MAILATAVPVFVDIAPGGDPASAGDDWVWVDISKDVRDRDGVTIVDGRTDEANQVDARSVALTINNGASNVAGTLGQVGCYSPRNPQGPYYGLLRKNMPIRVGVKSADDEFGRTASNGWGTADWGGDWAVTGTASNASVSGGLGLRTFPAANSAQGHTVTGGGGTDMDITMTCATPNAVTGAALVCGLIARWTSITDFYSGWVEFGTGGTLGAKIRRFSSGTEGSAELAVLNPIPSATYTAGTFVNVRFQVDGARLRLKVWQGSTEPAAWTLTADDPYLTQGGDVGVYMWRVNGNTNATGPHFQVDSFHAKSVEAVANVTELPVRWDMTATDSWSPMRAAGVLRRLNQGAPALNSPLYNQLVRTTGIVGLWMGEDGAEATSLAPGDSRNAPATLEGPYDMAADNTLPGARTTFKLLDGTSRARATPFRQLVTPDTGFSFMVFFKFDSAPTIEHEIFKLKVGGVGPVGLFRVRVSTSGTMTLYGYAGSDNTELINEPRATGLDFTKWTAVQLETETVGATVTWTIIVHEVGASTGFGAWSGTQSSFSIPRSSVLEWQLTGNGNSPVAYSTIYVGSNALPFVDANFALVSNGYQGETAGARIDRVMNEAGIPFTLESGDTSELGYQPDGDALAVARDAEAADGGIIYERGVGLAYRPRSARYNRAVELTVDMTAGQIQPPEPTDDDRYERNDVTVTRVGGGSARSSDEDRIALVGRYPDSVTVNVFRDVDLPDQASWRRSLGTVDDLRWPTLDLNFRRTWELASAWRYRTFGCRLQATGEPAQILGSPPDVIVEGTTQVIKNDQWTATLNTSPARAYTVGVYDATSSRYDTEDALSVANKGVGTGGTYSTTYGTIYSNIPSTSPQWGTQTPYIIVMGGEEMIVNSVFTSGSDQGLNVTRSANGVVKTHVAGEQIRLADPVRYAL